MVKPRRLRFTQQLSRYAKVSPFGRGGKAGRLCRRGRARSPAAPPLPTEAGAGSAVRCPNLSRENAKPGGPQTARLCSVKIIFPLKMRKANAARIQNRPPFCAQRCCGAGFCLPQAGWDAPLGQRQGGVFRLPLYSACTHSRIRSGRLVTMASGCSGSRSRTASSASTVQKATLMPRSCRRCTMPGCW